MLEFQIIGDKWEKFLIVRELLRRRYRLQRKLETVQQKLMQTLQQRHNIELEIGRFLIGMEKIGHQSTHHNAEMFAGKTYSTDINVSNN